MKVELKGKVLVIEIETQTPTPSASGKNLLVASTHGNLTTGATLNGKPITVSVNAYIHP